MQSEPGNGGKRRTPSLIGLVLGRYRLERQLGQGGMGVVYAARHQELGKAAAVKIVHERHGTSERIRARFLREGQAASRIRHPNIVDVYDVGMDSGRVYLVMELLEGEDLRSLLLRQGPLSEEHTADILIPVIAAVAAAHDHEVVHRDLKPDNIYLSEERGGIVPKILDFGISKVTEPGRAATVTGSGTLLGTPYYMSPEQAKTEPEVDARSDQYSLGVIMYECVTGRRPIVDPALYQLIHRIVEGDFAAPRQVNPNISTAFETAIQRAMAREPSERFPTTRHLGRALLPFASERVRCNYVEELRDGPRSSAERPVPTPIRTPDLGTTIREPDDERNGSRWVARRRKLALPIASAALVLGIAGVVAYELVAPEPGANRHEPTPATVPAPLPR